MSHVAWVELTLETRKGNTSKVKNRRSEKEHSEGLQEVRLVALPPSDFAHARIAQSSFPNGIIISKYLYSVAYSTNLFCNTIL
jgi:hypothetical protein